MTRSLSFLNRMSRLGVAAVTALLLGSTLAVGLHLHADGASHDDCAVCTVAQAPAQQTTAISLPSAPLVLFERVAQQPSPKPRTIDCAVPASRAPPVA